MILNTLMPSEESKTESMKVISQAKWSIQIVASKLENQAETLSMSRKHHRSHQITSDFYQRKIKDLKNSYDN
jgi:hypothetical protein